MDELRSALELATDQELQHLTRILFRRQFNPLDYWQTPEPVFVQSLERNRWIDNLEARFRYLAADGLTVLQGKTDLMSYRQILLQVCNFLNLSCSSEMSTTDLEAEVFLHLTGKAWRKLPRAEQTSLLRKVQHALSQTDLPEPLPVQLQHNPLGIFLRGGSTLMVSAVLKSILLKQIARQFALHFASYQMAKTAVVTGTAKVSSLIAAQAAKRGMTTTALRYGAMRSVLGVIAPAIWGWFLADLGWRAIATNYGRVIPTIITLAQIRLTREEPVWQGA